MTFTSPRAAFAGTISELQEATIEQLIGSLSASAEFDIVLQQRDAWVESIEHLRRALSGLVGFVALEFTIPRIGSRADAIVIVGSTIFVVEFKVGESKPQRADVRQVWDYALDLKYFHAASHAARIVPVLVPTSYESGSLAVPPPHADGCFPPVVVAPDQIRSLIDVIPTRDRPAIVSSQWFESPYLPTPTIIEAARRLYSQHSVADITRNDAGAMNLSQTVATIEAVIDEARRANHKSVVFVTGVPGAGKTLVGLDVATRKRKRDDVAHAVYLSGNGPLVAVLRESLARDESGKRKARGEPKSAYSKTSVMHEIKLFIQNVHHFRDEGLRSKGSPPEHVVIFDEAQRAWNLSKTAAFMARRKGVPNFGQSEPEFLLSYMDRHTDWSVVICLVGGGQEINDGEAGIVAWIEAIQRKFPQWRVYASPNLEGREYATDGAINALATDKRLTVKESLHLATSMRSFRAEQYSSFVNFLLELDSVRAREALDPLLGRYPIRITRSLSEAKAWLRAQARGSESYGIVASSKAQRLKPHAIDVRVNVDPKHWFLGSRSDTRSCYFLEDAATEFQVQGLEVDWACLSWDADLRLSGGMWNHYRFRGKSWQRVHKEANQRYLLNAYRVLLTRARQGLVIFVPPGRDADHTRRPAFYDETYEYLKSVGITPLS